MPTRLIAHQISKQQHRTEVETSLRDQLLPANELSLGLINQLRTAIGTKNPVAGRFTRHADTQPAFEQRLRRYLSGITDEAFIAFTRDATALLAREMADEQLATGGYVVFAEYEQADESYIVVVLLSTRAQPSFDDQLNLVASVTLDIEHLRHAGRIRQQGVDGNEDGVVHVLSRRGENVSDYFRLFLGCEDLTDSAAQGNLLFTAIRGLGSSGTVDTDAQELMRRTYSYWQDCRGKGAPMTLSGLANVLNPSAPAPVLDYLAHEDRRLSGEFPAPAPSVMKRFVTFAFSKGGLRIEFDRNSWLGKISVRGRSLTIREAPQELINQITEEKDER